MLEIKNNSPFTSTKVIEHYTGVKHQNILQLFRRHEKSIKKFGVIMFETWKPKKGSKGGRPETFYFLNEEQFTFFIMLMANNEKVVKFKADLNKKFHQYRKWILEQKTQKANEHYLETRNQSKIDRIQETDVIKIFVEYATKQGSKSANKYYMAISKMENQAFFIIKEKFTNVREILNIRQLNKITVADMIVRQALIEGMDKEMFYKDIFQLAKKRVVDLANSLGVKEIIPNLEIKQIK
jgi:phage regulator Rha-like protein